MPPRPLYTEVSMLELERLLDAAERGSLALPDFQRDFVWTTAQVRSLLATAFNGWPAGTLLLTRGNLHEFRLTPLDDAPPLRSVEYVVLDGQQRLTALFNALRGAGNTVYAVNFGDAPLVEEDDLEERLQAIDKDVWERRFGTPEKQLKAGLMPLTALMSPSDYFDWRDEILRHASDDKRRTMSRHLTDFYKERLAGIHRYSIPVVMLESSLDVTDVARIFEKVNRSGTQLSTFDLMVARVYESGWNLRDRWENARVDVPLLDIYVGRDAMPILQAIALRHFGDVRQRAVLNLREQVREEWDLAVRSVEEAIDFLIANGGVDDPNWLPYGAQLVALTAYAMDRDLSKEQAPLSAWFWGRSFGQGLDVAANTRIVADYRRLLDRSIAPDQMLIDPLSLQEATRKSHRAIWAAMMCLMSVRGGADIFGFLNARHFPGDSSSGYPRRTIVPLLEKGSGSASASHLHVLNLAIASKESAGLVRRLGFVNAAEAAAAQLGWDRVNGALEAQMLPTPDSEIWPSMTGEELLDYRLSRVVEDLESRGFRVGADLVQEG